MKSKALSGLIVVLMLLSVQAPSALAVGAKEAGASLLLPTTGQALNGEFGTTKSKIMAGVEVASITTIAVLGTAVGGGVVWAGLGPLLANHLYSAADAYKGAQNKRDPMVQAQMAEAQRTLEYSRERRFDREQSERGDLRDRMRQAAEAGYGS
ncbi:MAG TPA: hypothetical protein VL688_01545 [Verrucomicrobiae bacterium]|jgi:hypothetical protein|nr:hypothetical protein [Verrucomicrobiae bacterium]